MSYLKTAVVTVSKNNDTTLTCKLFYEPLLSFIIVYTKAIGFNNQSIKNIAQLELVISSLNNNSLFNFKHSCFPSQSLTV